MQLLSLSPLYQVAHSLVLMLDCVLTAASNTRTLHIHCSWLHRFVKKHRRRVVPVCTPSLLGAGSTPKPTWWLLVTAMLAAVVLAVATAAAVW
jgi:hypothetical protein